MIWWAKTPKRDLTLSKTTPNMWMIWMF